MANKREIADLIADVLDSLRGEPQPRPGASNDDGTSVPGATTGTKTAGTETLHEQFKRHQRLKPDEGGVFRQVWKSGRIIYERLTFHK